MKKSRPETEQTEDEDLRAEYDFSGGIRGKHHRLMQAGYTIMVHREDGSILTKEVEPREGAESLDRA